MRQPKAFALTLSCLVACTVSGQPASAAERVVDRVVAVIDLNVQGVSAQVLTMSELEFETRVALVQRGGTAASDAKLDASVLMSALDYAIGQRLHAAEADKLQVFGLEEGEVDRAMEAFEERIGGRQQLERFLARHEADRQMLGALLARSLRAERILDSKIRLKAQVTDAEVRRYYDAHQAELAGSYEELRAPLKDKLMRERYQQLARSEMAELRKTARVRIIAQLEVAP